MIYNFSINEGDEMTESEKLLGIINDISAEKNIGIFDSIIFFSEDRGIDIEDVIAILDTHMIELTKLDALNMGIVCNKKMFESKTTSLF